MSQLVNAQMAFAARLPRLIDKAFWFSYGVTMGD